MKRAEQISNHEPSGALKRHYKRLVKRARRRAERRDPENAPTRHPFFGYSR